MINKIRIIVNDEVFYINRNGAVENESSDVQVTAAELDRIHKTADTLHRMKDALIESAGGGKYEVDFFGGKEIGGVMIGCQVIHYDDIVRAHRLSRQLRAKRAKK